MRIELFVNDWENIPDFAKEDFLEDCPNCANGFIFVDLKESFKVVIDAKVFSFLVLRCDNCDYVRLNKIISESDVLKVESD